MISAHQLATTSLIYWHEHWPNQTNKPIMRRFFLYESFVTWLSPLYQVPESQLVKAHDSGHFPLARRVLVTLVLSLEVRWETYIRYVRFFLLRLKHQPTTDSNHRIFNARHQRLDVFFFSKSTCSQVVITKFCRTFRLFQKKTAYRSQIIFLITFLFLWVHSY